MGDNSCGATHIPLFLSTLLPGSESDVHRITSFLRFSSSEKSIASSVLVERLGCALVLLSENSDVLDAWECLLQESVHANEIRVSVELSEMRPQVFGVALCLFERFQETSRREQRLGNDISRPPTKLLHSLRHVGMDVHTSCGTLSISSSSAIGSSPGILLCVFHRSPEGSRWSINGIMQNIWANSAEECAPHVESVCERVINSIDISFLSDPEYFRGHQVYRILGDCVSKEDAVLATEYDAEDASDEESDWSLCTGEEGEMKSTSLPLHLRSMPRPLLEILPPVLQNVVDDICARQSFALIARSITERTDFLAPILFPSEVGREDRIPSISTNVARSDGEGTLGARGGEACRTLMSQIRLQYSEYLVQSAEMHFISSTQSPSSGVSSIPLLPSAAGTIHLYRKGAFPDPVRLFLLIKCEIDGQIFRAELLFS